LIILLVVFQSYIKMTYPRSEHYIFEISETEKDRYGKCQHPNHEHNIGDECKTKQCMDCGLYMCKTCISKHRDKLYCDCSRCQYPAHNHNEVLRNGSVIYKCGSGTKTCNICYMMLCNVCVVLHTHPCESSKHSGKQSATKTCINCFKNLCFLCLDKHNVMHEYQLSHRTGYDKAELKCQNCNKFLCVSCSNIDDFLDEEDNCDCSICESSLHMHGTLIKYGTETKCGTFPKYHCIICDKIICELCWEPHREIKHSF